MLISSLRRYTFCAPSQLYAVNRSRQTYGGGNTAEGICAGKSKGTPERSLPSSSFPPQHEMRHRCKAKYGKYWTQYTKAVPYRYIPGLW